LNADKEIRFQDNEYPIYLEDGDYKVECIGYDEPVPFEHTKKLFLHFRILTEPYAGEEIWAAFNLAFNHKVRPGSRYYKAWCLANGDRMPSRNAVMSPMIFKGKKFMARTRTVKPTRGMKRGTEEMGVEFWYSVVDHLKSLILPDSEEDSIA
jgi:hypothetical protein